MAGGAERRRHHVEVVNAKHAVDLATAQTYSENVFLFVPNIIGKCLTSLLRSVVFLTTFRLYPRHSRCCVSSLYEFSPQGLDDSVLCVLSS